MKLNDKDMDAIGKVLLVIFCFLMLMFSIETKAQTFTVTKCDMHDHYVIDFIDEFDDTYYINGDKVISKGKLDLTEKEYKQLIKDIKKTLKYTEHEINRENTFRNLEKLNLSHFAGSTKLTIWLVFNTLISPPLARLLEGFPHFTDFWCAKCALRAWMLDVPVCLKF